MNQTVESFIQGVHLTKTAYDEKKGSWESSKFLI